MEKTEITHKQTHNTLYKTKNFSPQEDTDGSHNNTCTIGRWKFGTGDTPQLLDIAAWNVNGIRGIINPLRNGLHPYLKSQQPDILCMTATKINLASFDRSPVLIGGGYE